MQDMKSATALPPHGRLFRLGCADFVLSLSHNHTHQTKVLHALWVSLEECRETLARKKATAVPENRYFGYHHHRNDCSERTAGTPKEERASIGFPLLLASRNVKNDNSGRMSALEAILTKTDAITTEQVDICILGKLPPSNMVLKGLSV